MLEKQAINAGRIRNMSYESRRYYHFAKHGATKFVLALGRAQREADLVRDNLQAYAIEQLADPEAAIILDETGVIKKGD